MKDLSRPVGHIPSGLFIVTAVDGEQKDGYLASWVQQVSFDPLMASLAVKPDRPCYGPIMEGKIFAINVVGDHQTDYLKYFWKGYEKSPFGQVPHEVTEEGALILREAKSAMVCRMDSKAVPGDHTIIFAKVLGGRVMDEASRSKVHLRKTGLDY